MIDTVPAFVQAVRRSRLLAPQQLNELKLKLVNDQGDPRILAERLVLRGWLTDYQAEQLLNAGDPELVLGPYRLMSVIGSGGLCKVYKAWHVDTQSVVALKVIHAELRDNAEVLEQFRVEMEVMAELDHPNFVRALHVGAGDNKYYFAMEYVEGIDLKHLLQQIGPLPVPQACEYARQTAFGLQYAFEQGLVHRDIKPANLLVAFDDDRLRILDIGLARLEWSFRDNTSGNLGSSYRGAALMGTPDYIAPEQAVNPAQANIRADLYSLGCTLYHLLTGQPPFPGNSLTRKLLDHQQTPPPSPQELRPEVSPELAAVVQKMMAKSPDERYQTPAGVAVALVPHCREDGTRVSLESFRPLRPALARPRPSSPSVRRPAPAAAPAPAPRSSRAAADPSSPPYGSPGLPERRAHPRRWGNPVTVKVAADDRGDEPLTGYILNRSAGGVALVLDEALEVGTVVRVWPNSTYVVSRWVPVKVIYCIPERASWRVGCQFLERLTWGDLRLFG